MTVSRHDIFVAISRERDYQDSIYGGRPHAVPGWILIMETELEEAKKTWVNGLGEEAALCEILQVVSVGVAALEQYGIFERQELEEKKWRRA